MLPTVKNRAFFFLQILTCWAKNKQNISDLVSQAFKVEEAMCISPDLIGN